MSRALITALEKLIGNAKPAPFSLFTASQRDALNELLRKTGVIRSKPQGAGWVYEIVNAQLLQEHLKTLRPHASTDLEDSLPKRAANIAKTRNSKGGRHNHDCYYLLIKPIGSNVIWRHDDGRVLNLSEISEISGAGVLAIQSDDSWHTDLPFWMVENQALFDRLDWMPPNSKGTITYYAGQLNGQLLNWLSMRKRAPQIVFFPDYDGVGLLNYAKLLESARCPCAFWLIPGWQQLLKNYGNNAVWQNTRSDFESALARFENTQICDELRQFCKTLSSNGLALEHEAVWLVNLSSS